jgi:hypothetical protein
MLKGRAIHIIPAYYNITKIFCQGKRRIVFLLVLHKFIAKIFGFRCDAERQRAQFTLVKLTLHRSNKRKSPEAAVIGSEGHF